jgi:hypothetical protein
MQLGDYLQHRPTVKVTQGLGKESDWLDFTELHLPSGKLHVMDPGYALQKQTGTIQLPPGVYSALAKVITYGSDSRISRLRVIQPRAVAVLGDELDHISSDIGKIAVADQEAYLQQWPQDPERVGEVVDSHLTSDDAFGVAELGGEPPVRILFIESGFGDGTFPIFALEKDGRRVGAEIVFIRADEPYPF